MIFIVVRNGNKNKILDLLNIYAFEKQDLEIDLNRRRSLARRSVA